MKIGQIVYSKAGRDKGYALTVISNGKSGVCPVCNGHLIKVNYCQRCGQALDWSDTE